MQTFFGTVVGATHGYIQGTVNGVPGGVETPAIVAWLRYWIYNDQGARRYLYGDDCVMCASPWAAPQLLRTGHRGPAHALYRVMQSLSSESGRYRHWIPVTPDA